ncbi:MAG TPA: LPS assembly protein LptD [Candidatus Limnocylindrales bacterium]|nr:LPS assembly protein LptD [Candidatus Limnocylindrales bacterium]
MENFSKKTSPTDASTRRTLTRRRAIACSLAICPLMLISVSHAGVETGGAGASPTIQSATPSTSGAIPGATPAPSDAKPAAEDATPAAPAVHGNEPAAAPAATTPAAGAGTPAKSPITVEADSLEVEKEGGKAHASGNVVVEWDTSRLRANDVRVNQREREVEATGDVVYESDEYRATAKSAKLDVDEETGRLDEVDVHFTDDPGRFGGSKVKKLEGRHVVVQNGYYTTCDTDLGHPPDWELRGKHLDVRFDDYARMRNPHLEIRGVPVLYLPYLIFPTKETRQSGLLPFSVGTSTNRGFVFDLPAYWAIDKHQDLTMTAAVETSARLGVDGMYRYAPSRKRWGELRASYYNEAIRGDPKAGSPAVGVPENRGSVELVHREYLSKWTGYADVMWVGDQRFLREINVIDSDAPSRDVRRTLRYTSSRIGAFTSRGFTAGGVETAEYQDLVGFTVEDARHHAVGDGHGRDSSSDPVRRDTVQKPLNAWLQTDRNFGPVAFAFDSSAAAFVRDKGASGERVDFVSTMALPLLTDGPVWAKAWANGRGTAYAMTTRTVLSPDETPEDRLDPFPTRGILSGGVDTRTKLAREYAFTDSSRWSGLYHSLEPFVGMRYVALGKYDDIPLFDRLDAIDGRDVVTYGVDSRFLLKYLPGTGKAGHAPFEFGRLSLSQTYNLGQQVVNYEHNENVVGEHFSDIDLAAFVQPFHGFAVRTLTSYNVGASEVRGANASISWETGPIGPFLRGKNSQIAAAYRYVRSDTSENNVLQSTEMLARLAFTKNFALGLKGLYDIAGNKFVEEAVGVTFTSSCDCWSVGLGVVDRVNPGASGLTGPGDRNPNELQVRLAFELKGLGGFGSGVTQRNSPALDSIEYDDIGFWRAGW